MAEPGEPSPLLLEDDELINVAGESHYQDAILAACGPVGPGAEVRHPCEATLVREPENPHDANAVRVEIGGRRVGYLPRADAERYQPLLRRLAERGRAGVSEAMIAGRGGATLGVFLKLPYA